MQRQPLDDTSQMRARDRTGGPLVTETLRRQRDPPRLIG
jgi:hypothetical protein